MQTVNKSGGQRMRVCCAQETWLTQSLSLTSSTIYVQDASVLVDVSVTQNTVRCGC